MAYGTLPPVYQNVIFESNSYISKWLVFLFLLFISYYYLTVSWKNQEPTKFFTILALRLLFLGLSVGYLVWSPYTLLLMSPELSFHEFYSFHLTFYVIVGSITMLMLLIDFLRYGFIGILKMGGLDLGDSNTNEIINQLEKRKHFMKLGKKK